MDNPIIADENLAIVHSYLCADGYVSGTMPGRKQALPYRAEKYMPLLLADFQSRFAMVFRKKPIISKCQDRCKIGDKEIFCWLKATFGSFHSADWTLPNCFLTKELLAPWLRTFFDCEGWVEATARKSRVIGLESINVKELEKNTLLSKTIFPDKFRNSSAKRKKHCCFNDLWKRRSVEIQKCHRFSASDKKEKA